MSGESNVGQVVRQSGLLDALEKRVGRVAPAIAPAGDKRQDWALGDMAAVSGSARSQKAASACMARAQPDLRTAYALSTNRSLMLWNLCDNARPEQSVPRLYRDASSKGVGRAEDGSPGSDEASRESRDALLSPNRLVVRARFRQEPASRTANTFPFVFKSSRMSPK